MVASRWGWGARPNGSSRPRAVVWKTGGKGGGEVAAGGAGDTPRDLSRSPCDDAPTPPYATAALNWSPLSATSHRGAALLSSPMATKDTEGDGGGGGGRGHPCRPSSAAGPTLPLAGPPPAAGAPSTQTGRPNAAQCPAKRPRLRRRNGASRTAPEAAPRGRRRKRRPHNRRLLPSFQTTHTVGRLCPPRAGRRGKNSAPARARVRLPAGTPDRDDRVPCSRPLVPPRDRPAPSGYSGCPSSAA